jgi:hypothetical protein
MCFQILMTLLLCVSAFTPETTNGTLKGHILDLYGGSATETQVRIVQWYFVGGEPRTTCDKVVYTDSDGNFSVQVPPGIYDVFVSRADSEPVGKKVKIVANQETFFNPKLKGSPVVQYIE